MKLFEAFIDGLAKSFTLKGTTTRSEYWLFALASFLIAITLGLMAVQLLIVYNILIMPAAFTLIVRRMKDAGRSPWVLLVSLIPFIGGFWLLYLLLQPSKAQPGDYSNEEPSFA